MSRSVTGAVMGSVLVLGCLASPPPERAGKPVASQQQALPDEVAVNEPSALAAASGTWLLKTLNGKPLPVVLATKIKIHSSRLTIKFDGTHTHASAWSLDKQKGDAVAKGAALAAGERVTLRSSGGTHTAVVAGDTLTGNFNNDVYVFARDRSASASTPKTCVDVLANAHGVLTLNARAKTTLRKETNPSSPAITSAQVDQAAALLGDSCTKDAWSPDAIACFATAELAKVRECMQMIDREVAVRIDADIEATFNRVP